MARKRVKKRARPSKSGKTVATASPMSLPPSGTALAVAASPSVPATTEPDAKKPYWFRTKDSKVYDQAMRVFAMRAAGISDREIANALDILPQSLWNICYIAGRNGWVSDQLANAKDVVEFQIMPKVMRELEAGLDDAHRNEKTGMKVSTHVALKIAEGTVFPKFEQAAAGAATNNIIAIRIENIPGPPQQMRAGTVGGVPAYQDAEVVDVGNTGLQSRLAEVHAEVGEGR